MPTASSLAWKTFRKVRTLWHCSRLRSVALYLWLIVVISVRQSTVAAISGLHCRALVMVSSSIRLTAWLQNSKKRAERSERRMYEQSHRDYLRSGYLHHRLPRHGLLIITVITLLPTKPSATKMPENWSWRTRQLLTCRRCVSVMLLRSMQNTRSEQADAQLKNDAAWWCCRWSSSVAASAVCQSVRELPVSASGVDNAASPRLADTAERDYFTPERGWSLCKNNWKEPRSILMSVSRAAHIDGYHAIIVE